jgi:DNA-directed RNA polymerase subunit RPC12/RpoP
MSEMKFSCPHCEQHLQCDERLGGRQITCPACHHLINIPPGPDQSLESGRTWDTFVPPKLPPDKSKPNL